MSENYVDFRAIKQSVLNIREKLESKKDHDVTEFYAFHKMLNEIDDSWKRKTKLEQLKDEQ